MLYSLLDKFSVFEVLYSFLHVNEYGYRVNDSKINKSILLKMGYTFGLSKSILVFIICLKESVFGTFLSVGQGRLQISLPNQNLGFTSLRKSSL